MSRTSILAVAGVVAGSFLSASAWAFPAASVHSNAPSAASSDLILVADGCGPGFHRGRWGHCRPNWEHRVCAPGWHYSSWRGHCVRNW